MMYIQYNTNMRAYTISAMGNTAYSYPGPGIAGTWVVGTANSPAPNVTKVTNTDSDNIAGKAFKVTFSNTHEAAGIYRESGTYNSFPAYKHKSLNYYIWTVQSGPTMYAHYLGTLLGGTPLWMLSNSSADNVAGSWGQATATIPGPIVTEYTE